MDKEIKLKIRQLSRMLEAQRYFFEAKHEGLKKEDALRHLKTFLRSADVRRKDLTSLFDEHRDTLWKIISMLSEKYKDIAFKFSFEDLEKEENLNKMNEAYEYVDNVLRQKGIIKGQSMTFVSAILSAVLGNTPVVKDSLLKCLNFTSLKNVKFKDVLREIIKHYRKNQSLYNIAIGILANMLMPQFTPDVVLNSIITEFIITQSIEMLIKKLEEYLNNNKTKN